MNWIQSASLLLLLTLVSACSSKSSADKLIKELQTITSWTATADMTGEAWVRGAVPTAYAKQSLQKAQQELENETTTLLEEAPAKKQKPLLDELRQIMHTVSQMSTAVEQENRTAMAQQLQQLSTEQQAISALAKTAGGPP